MMAKLPTDRTHDTPPSNNNSGNTRWLGISVDKWVQLFQSVGFPTALVGFLLYLAWCYIPPTVQGHLDLLQRTGDTLESVDKTLQQSNATLLEINSVEQSSKRFMDEVQAAHESQNKKLETILTRTEKPGGT